MSANGKAAEAPEGGEAEEGEQQQAQQQPPEAAAPAAVATAQPSMAPASSAAGEMVISPKSRSVAEVVVEGSWVSERGAGDRGGGACGSLCEALLQLSTCMAPMAVHWASFAPRDA